MSDLKLAIISDIHGNYTAFEAVLAELKSANVSKIVCLGDVLQGGHQPRKVLQKLKELDLPVVAGNADEEVIDANSPRNYVNEIERKLHDIDKWTLAQLSSSDREYIRSFKPIIQIPLSKEKNLLCFHGSPRSNREGIFPTTTEEDLAAILSPRINWLMACGHTHSQMFRRYLESIIINPGSVGLPFQFETIDAFKKKQAYNPTFAEYAILDYSDEGPLIVELCRVTIDHDKLISSILESGMPHADQATKDWRRN